MEMEERQIMVGSHVIIISVVKFQHIIMDSVEADRKNGRWSTH